jgi:hypothetical protein
LGSANDPFLDSVAGDGYELIASLGESGGSSNGFAITVLADKSGTFDVTGVTGYADLALGLKTGNLKNDPPLKWGVFLLGELTGVWKLVQVDSKGPKLIDLSGAFLYGTPKEIPLPGALVLLMTALGSLCWFGRRQNERAGEIAA